MTDKVKDQYEFWRRRLAGEELPIHDGEYQPGFYRLKTKDGTSHAVAYWFAKDGTIRCRIGTKDVNEQTAAERWMWASKHPITHELYKEIIAGGHWPDQHEAVTRSNNAPPDDSLEGLQAAIDDLAREAETLIKGGGAKSQDAADRASDLANRLSGLQTKADTQRKIEKQPHLDAERAVDDKWRPVITAGDVYKRLKAAVVEPFLKAARDAKLKAEAEARAKAAEAARSGDAAKVEEAQRAVAAAEATSVGAGTRGRKVGLRAAPAIVTITDRAKLLEYFADRQEITDALQTMAEKAVKAGVTPPGVSIEKDSKAA